MAGVDLAVVGSDIRLLGGSSHDERQVTSLSVGEPHCRVASRES
jgi:hypothetical protein